MSVLIISPYYFQQKGARVIQVRKLCDGLSKRSIDYYLATYKNDGNTSNDKHIFELTKKTNLFDMLLGGAVSQNIKPLAQFIKKKNVTTLLTISTPAYSAFIGLALKKYFKELNWISYYSDPMPVYIYPEPYFPVKFYFPVKSYFKLRLKFLYQKHKMKQAFDVANKIILPAKKTLLYLEKTYNKKLESKTEIIPHIGGKLSDDYEFTCREKLGKSLVYFGSIYNRVSIPLVEAVKLAKKNFPDTFQGLIFYVSGDTTWLREVVIELNARHVIKIKNAVSYKESLFLMRQSAALLLVEADMKESPFMPSKYFDYLFADRPILAVAPLKNSLNEHYQGKNDILIVQHKTEEIFLAIEKIFCQPQKKIKRDLDHLLKEKIVEKYINLINA